MGQHLLAGTALAGDEDGGVGARHLAGGGEQRLHGGGAISEPGAVHHAPEVGDLGLQARLLLPLPLALALDEPRPVEGHRHLGGEGVEELPVRSLEGHAVHRHFEHDAAEAAVLEEEGQGAERHLAALAHGLRDEVAFPARPLRQGQVARGEGEGTGVPAGALEAAQQLEAAALRALEHSHAAGVQRLEQALGEAARQLGGLGRGGHDRHRVQQQPHVPVVLRLVAREDALEPVQAAGLLHVRALLPQADVAGVAALGRAEGLVRAPDQLLRVHQVRRIGQRHPGAELEAQDAFVVLMVAEAAQEVFRHHPSILGGRVEQDDGEHRTPVPRDVVLAAKAAAQFGGDLPQDLVAGTAIQPLVDPPEVVGPEQQEHRGQLFLLDVGEGRLELGLEDGPLGQLRDVIESGPGDGARVGRKAGGEAEEPLPPAFVAERVGGGGKPQEVAASARGLAIEPQADQRRQLRRGRAIALPPLRAGRVLLHPGYDPA